NSEPSRLPDIEEPAVPAVARLAGAYIQAEVVDPNVSTAGNVGDIDVVEETPAAAPQGTATKYDQFVIKTIAPEAALDLIVGVPKILVLKSIPRRIRVEDAENGIAMYTLLSDRELSVVGKKPGRTVLNLWFEDSSDLAGEKVLSYRVHVFGD